MEISGDRKINVIHLLYRLVIQAFIQFGYSVWLFTEYNSVSDEFEFAKAINAWAIWKQTRKKHVRHTENSSKNFDSKYCLAGQRLAIEFSFDRIFFDRKLTNAKYGKVLNWFFV